MTVWCDDGGSDTSPYDSWAKAATTFLVAVDQLVAGEDLIIGANHSEQPGVNRVYTFPGTAAAPNRVISATVGTTTYNKANNVQIDNATGLFDISIGGFVKLYGTSMKLGDDFLLQTSPSSILFDDCVIELTKTANANFVFGSTAGQNIVRLKNSVVSFSGGAANSGFSLSTCIFEWDGGILSWAGTQPTALFNTFDRTVILSVAGVDITDITTALVDVSDAADIIAEFHHCHLAVGVKLTEGTINSVGTKVLMSGCDNATDNKLYRSEYEDYYGSIFNNAAIFRTTDGAKDPAGNKISWKMITTGNAKVFSEPLISSPLGIWNDTTGSRTFKVNCLWDSVVNIKDDQIWLEIEYLGFAGNTDSIFSSENTGAGNDGLDNILASNADQTTNAIVWTEDLTNENEFELSVTVTVNRVGPVIGRIHLAEPNTTVYIDALMEAA